MSTPHPLHTHTYLLLLSRVRLWSSRVESRTVLPMVINTFKPKYAVQRYLGLH